MTESLTEYLDLAGVLWFARPDVENPGPMRDGGQPWEIGTIDEHGAEVLGDWLPEADALAEIADLRLQDERRADEEYERRFFRD